MTLPVPVFKDTHLFNTRRTVGGAFRLRPDPVVNKAVKFCLAYTAQKNEIELHAHSSLSNHQHTSLYDPHGRHPVFRQEFHSLLARAINRHRGDQEVLWTPDHKSPIVLCDADSVLDHIAYSTANSCWHDLTDDPDEWPGVVSLVEQLAGPPEVVTRPEILFSEKGTVPETALLEYVKPRILADLTDDEYRAQVAQRVEEKCQAAKESRKKRGVSVLGRVKALAQSPDDTSKSQPEAGTLNPRVASTVRALRIAILLWLKAFRRDHREARVKFEAGDRSAEFPFGTYLHQRRYGVNCSTTGPPTLEDLPI